MSSPTVHSMKSMGYGKISVRSLTHTRRLHEVLFSNKISVLYTSEQLGAEPPYYVWDGPTQGWATHPMRKGLARGPPWQVSQHPIRRRRPDLPRHMTAVVFHQDQPPRQESHHGCDNSDPQIRQRKV